MPVIIIRFFASLVIWLMFAGILILWVINGKVKKEIVLHAMFAFILAWLVTELIKSVMPSLRPFVTDNLPILTLTIPNPYGSFPSSHAASAFALATTIWLHHKKIGWIYLFFAATVGIGRVLANVHYPVDVMAGTIIGVMVAFMVEKLHIFRLFSSKIFADSKTRKAHQR